MIDLYQLPWSPFCIVQRRILEFGRIPFRLVNVSSADRMLIWKLTKERYYQVPIIKDGKTVIFETGDDSQVIAKYLTDKFGLSLFPEEWRGIQLILARVIENEIEGLGFKLNDVYWQEFVPRKDRLGFIRHKERKFGRGCLDRWREEQPALLDELTRCLIPFEHCLSHRPFLLDTEPRFVDFDLFGMLGNFLYSGHYQLPHEHSQVRAWYSRLASIKRPPSAREKLHS